MPVAGRLYRQGFAMPERSASTLVLQGCLDRLQAGDPAAQDELFRHAAGRLRRLSSRLLDRFPGVRRWAQTDDVLQSALVRLLRALQAVRPTSVREFFALSAQQVRRELLDLARHWFGPQGPGANHVSPRPAAAGPDPVAAAEPDSLAEWCEFHRQAQLLPDLEREVVDLLYYQGLSQAEAAELLTVTVRTIQRRWQSALLLLHERIGRNG
jgi:RNA polymerase sigma-70 factor (ECF subfamily)